jgi:hypothetical protein
MASTATPAEIFGTGYDYGTNQILLNTAGHATPLLTELTAAEAAEATGVAEEVIFALLEMLRTKIASPATTGTVLSGVKFMTQDIAAIPGTVRRSYQFFVDIDTETQSVDV